MGLNPGFRILAEAARALHSEVDLDHLMSWAAEGARAVTGAASGGAWDRDSGWTTSPTSEGGRPGVGALGDIDKASSLGLRLLLRDREILAVDDLSAGTPEARDLDLLLPGFSSLLVVPVPRRAGDGALAVASPTASHFSGEAVEAVMALGAHLGVALDNLAQRRAVEQARATERQLVDQLQEAVVPARPDVPNMELGAFYTPADPSAATGGDLHDWILLPDGDLHFAIVDVMGKGVAATKDALTVSHVLRLLVLDGCPLEDLVKRADVIVTAQNPELVATLLVGRYRPSTGRLRIAGGGHPPALLVRNRKAIPLVAAGVPIGWPGAGSDDIVEADLERSDTVILYTDGLIEGKRDILEGLADLTRFAEETAGYPAQQQARILIERALTGAARLDDSLALVLRCRRIHHQMQRHPLAPFEHHLSRSMAAVSVGRGLLKEWLVRVPVDPSAVQDLLLAATELAANAVEHARWTGIGVVLRAMVDNDDIVVEVEDDGAGLSWPYLADEPPDPGAEEGRGLWLVQAFCDGVSQQVTGTGTVVRCLKLGAVLDSGAESGGTEAIRG